jgi:N-acetylneuraminic acid mutarotase
VGIINNTISLEVRNIIRFERRETMFTNRTARTKTLSIVICCVFLFFNLAPSSAQPIATHEGPDRPTYPPLSWHALPNKGFDSTVEAIAFHGDDMYVAGYLKNTGDGFVKDLGRIARYNFTDQAWYALPNKGLDLGISCLEVSGNYLYVGGFFTQTGDGTIKNLGHIVRYNFNTKKWEPLPHNGLNGYVNTIFTHGSDLYVGGSFLTTGDSAVENLNHVARFNTNTNSWHALPNKGLDGYFVQTMAAVGNSIYMGGLFTATADSSINNLGSIVSYNTYTKTWQPMFNKGLSLKDGWGAVYVLVVIRDQLYAGGDFDQTGDGSVSGLGHIARYDLHKHSWHAFTQKGLNGNVMAMTVSGDDLYVGGIFTATVAGPSTDLNAVARYDLKNDTWHAMPNKGLDDTVKAIAISNSDLFAGGYFYPTGDGVIDDLGHIARCELDAPKFDFIDYLPLVLKR